MKRALALAPRLGITRVANITGLDHVGMPVYAAYRPNARSIVVSQGKGLTAMAAKASALMEAIEGYHAEHVDLPLRLASTRELEKRSPLCRVERLPRVSIGSYHPDKRLLWCAGTDLVTGEQRLVPYELVHTDFTVPLPSGSGSFMMSSNGLASGNHPLEAESHAICELVERDAMALWDLAGGSGSADGRLNLDSVVDDDCAGLIERLRAAKVALGIWDVTSDIGLPTFACVLADKEPDAFGQTYTSHGSGCHPTRHIALLRALTEAAQTRLTYIAGARDDGDRAFFARARASSRVERVRRELLDESGAQGDFQAAPSKHHETFAEDIAWELERLAAVGIEEVMIVDLSQEDLGVSVVRAIIAGLEGLHDAPGYAPGPRARRRRDDLSEAVPSAGNEQERP